MLLTPALALGGPSTPAWGQEAPAPEAAAQEAPAQEAAAQEASGAVASGAMASSAMAGSAVAGSAVASGAEVASEGGAFSPGMSDATYDRIESDLQLALGLGVALGEGVRGAGELRLRYLSTVGLYGAYEDGAAFGTGADPGRVIAYGFELRPLFLARWLRGWQLGNAFVDLLLDSFALELGAFHAQPAGVSGFVGQPGLELGVGLELPVFARATGLWVSAHGGMRFGYDALSVGDTSSPLDRTPFLRIALAWHQLLPGHLVVGRGLP